MSGIAGIINFNGEPVAKHLLEQMVEAAAYRGVDGIHHWVDNHIGLSHLALHITPQESNTIQPLGCAQKQLVLAADARIDNRIDLIEGLKANGFLQSKQVSDAALILAAYQCWGTRCAEQLMGDFAFAIWDQVHQHLYAARDPLGMRSFIYRHDGQRFLFATEVQQILAFPRTPVDLFEPALGAYLSGPRGSLAWTFYRGILQLPPAHALVVTSSGLKIWRYWDIDPADQTTYSRPAQYVEHFLEIFREAVKCRLRSHYPVSLLLSGGMDSGSIAAMAGHLIAQASDDQWPSFYTLSHAFEELVECDERYISRHITDHYPIPTIDVPADSVWPMSHYPQQGPDRDSPFTEVYQSLFERSADLAQAKGIRVLMTGERGDEVVGDCVYDLLGLQSGQWLQAWRELRADQTTNHRSFRASVRAQILTPLALDLGIINSNPIQYPDSYPEWICQSFADRIHLSDIIRQTDTYNPFKSTARRRRYQRIFMLAGTQIASYRERKLAQKGLSFADPWSDQRLAKFILSIPPYLVNRPTENNAKRRLPLNQKGGGGFHPGKCLLTHFYVPERKEDKSWGNKIVIQPLPPKLAFMEIIRNSFIPEVIEGIGLQRSRLSIISQIAQKIPVRRLIYPSGIEYLPAVREAILRDLSQKESGFKP